MWFQCSALKQSNYRLCLSGDFQLISLPIFLGFPGGSEGKQSACNAGDLSSITWVGTIPWRRKWQPTPVFLPGESGGQRSLAGYSPWGHRVGHNWEHISRAPIFLLHFTPRPVQVHRSRRYLLSEDLKLLLRWKGELKFPFKPLSYSGIKPNKPEIRQLWNLSPTIKILGF